MFKLFNFRKWLEASYIVGLKVGFGLGVKIATMEKRGVILSPRVKQEIEQILDGKKL